MQDLTPVGPYLYIMDGKTSIVFVFISLMTGQKNHPNCLKVSIGGWHSTPRMHAAPLCREKHQPIFEPNCFFPKLLQSKNPIEVVSDSIKLLPIQTTHFPKQEKSNHETA